MLYLQHKTHCAKFQDGLYMLDKRQPGNAPCPAKTPGPSTCQDPSVALQYPYRRCLYGLGASFHSLPPEATPQRDGGRRGRGLSELSGGGA